jgi:hypothetical protein
MRGCIEVEYWGRDVRLHSAKNQSLAAFGVPESNRIRVYIALKNIILSAPHLKFTPTMMLEVEGVFKPFLCFQFSPVSLSILGLSLPGLNNQVE